MPPPDLSFDSLITIRWDDDEGRPVYDIGDLDIWSATAIIRAVLEAVEAWLPTPRDISEDPADLDDE